LPDIGLRSCNELVDNIGLQFKPFAEGDGHYPRADVVYLWSAEGKIVHSSIEGLEFLMTAVIANANDWNLALDWKIVM
jgi:hypothetical protein